MLPPPRVDTPSYGEFCIGPCREEYLILRNPGDVAGESFPPLTRLKLRLLRPLGLL